MLTTLFRNAAIYTPVDGGKPLAGKLQGQVRSWEKGALLCDKG